MSCQRSYLFIIVILISIFTSCKSTNKIPKETENAIAYKKLSWSDFKGKIDTSLKYYAMTYWAVNYNYDEPIFKGNEAIPIIKITYGLKNSSWYKPSKISDSLLNHEQGHLDIGYLLALDLKKNYKENGYTRENYSKKIDSIYYATEKKYLQLELLYDKETNHMYNISEQKRWDKFLKREIKRLNKIVK